MLLTKTRFRWLNRTLLFYVGVVAYSRVYLGNHYPADIVGGWVVGFFAAIVTYYFYRSLAGEKFDLTDSET